MDALHQRGREVAATRANPVAPHNTASPTNINGIDAAKAREHVQVVVDDNDSDMELYTQRRHAIRNTTPALIVFGEKCCLYIVKKTRYIVAAVSNLRAPFPLLYVMSGPRSL